MHLTISLAGHGFHPAAWRLSSLPDGPGMLPDYRGLVQAAEAAAIDAVLFGPSPYGPTDWMDGGQEALAPDPLPQLASLIPRTTRIGLAGSVQIGHTEPFHTARAFAVMDNLSAGRTALIADTRAADQQPEDFAHAPREPAQAFPRAREYLDVVARLWESWEPDAIEADKESGHFADGMKVHRIDHAGDFFRVRGPLTAVRAPQGRPVLIQRDDSPAGLELAADTAEIFLARPSDMAGAMAFTAALKQRARLAGRAPGALRVLVEILVCGDPEALGPMPPGLCFGGSSTELAAMLAEWHAAGACDGFNIMPALLPDDLAMFCEAVQTLRAQGLRHGYTGTTLREHLSLPAPPTLPRREVA